MLLQNRKLLIAIAWHYLAYIIMSTMALFSEVRRGPAIPDLLHEFIIQVDSLSVYNSIFWLNGLILCLFILAFVDKTACIRYLWLGGILSILRGLFIVLTSLGPPYGTGGGDLTTLTVEQIDLGLLFHHWFPFDVLWGGSKYSAAYLTQDLFFSGHTSSTFLLLLVTSRRSKVFWLFLFFHIATILLLLFTHIHYSIDILAAYFISYAVYKFFEESKMC